MIRFTFLKDHSGCNTENDEFIYGNQPGGLLKCEKMREDGGGLQYGGVVLMVEGKSIPYHSTSLVLSLASFWIAFVSP